jgi:hypothetical protein
LLPTDGADPALGELREMSSLQQLVRWSFGRGVDIAEVVVQDEFSHDVVIALGERWLVADCT